MKMKSIKWFIVCLCVFCLCACSPSMGHFEDGSIELNELVRKINEKSANGEWEFPILQEKETAPNIVSTRYAIDLTQVMDGQVYEALLPAQIGEIAFFHMEEGKEALVKQAIQHRLKELKKEWGTLIYDADELINTCIEGKIGEYYYVMIGRDAQKVVNYIQDIK